MRITNNIMAMNTHRQYTVNNEAVAKSTAKLSSGYRINSAADDAAGLAISEKMRAQIRGLDMASKNSEDAISLIQTAEGALTETHAILQRMRELSVQSASDTNQDAVDRDALDAEFGQLKQEIDDIAGKTKFNNMSLLDGTYGVSVNSTASSLDDVVGVSGISVDGAAAGEVFTFADDGTDLTVTRGSDGATFTIGSPAGGAGTIDIAAFGITLQTKNTFVAGSLDGTVNMSAGGGGTIQTGANNGDTLSISIGDMSASGLALTAARVDSQANASSAINSVDSAINLVSDQRANLGALQNRLQHKINNLNTSSENLQAAESRIRDLDMAAEMTTYTKNNIMVQAATSMLAQANSAPQNVLTLLRQ